MLRWRSSVQQLRIFLVLLSTIPGEIVLYCRQYVQVSSATAVIACSSGRRSSKGKHSSAKAETEAEQPQSRPS